MRKARPARVALAAVCVALAAAAIFPAYREPIAAAASAPAFRSRYFSDTDGSQADYLDVAGTLGLIAGERGMGGRAWPGGAVTRLEVAVAVERLLSLDPSFEAAAPDSLPFADAAAIPAWAVSSVSACHSLGFMTGFPDGAGGLRFAPDDHVMAIDAVVTLLRALGDAGEIQGGFPVGYLYRAYEVGLLSTDAVPGDWRFLEPLTPVTRAQFAYLLTQALGAGRDFAPGGPGRPGTYGRGPLGGQLSGYALVIDVDPAKRTFRTADGKTYTLSVTVVAAGIAGPEDLIARRIFWQKNRRGQVALVRGYARGPAQAGLLEKLEVAAGGRVEAVVLEGGRRIPCLPGAVVDVNGLRWPFDPAILRPGAEATVLMEGEAAVRVYLLHQDWPEGIIRSLGFGVPVARPDGTTATTGVVVASLGMGDTRIRLEVTGETRIFLNGDRAGLADLREGDVFSASTSGIHAKRLLRLDVTRDRIDGVLRRLSLRRSSGDLRWRFLVNTSPGWTEFYSVSPFAGHEATEAMPGEEYSLYLNPAGQVAYFAQALPPEKPSVVKILRFREAEGKRLLTVDWHGREMTVELRSGVAPLPAGILARLTVDMAGAAIGLWAAFPPRVDATWVAVDPGTRQATLSRGSATWILDLSGVPIYAIPSPFEVGSVGDFVSPQHIRPGSPVWLDRTGNPGYVLVFTRERS